MPKLPYPPLSKEAKKLERILRKTPMDEWVIVVGNGVTGALLEEKVRRQLEWGNILTRWLGTLKVPSRVTNEEVTIASNLITSGKVDFMLEAADFILSRLEEKETVALLAETFGDLVDQTKLRRTGGYCWGCFFQDLNSAVGKGEIPAPVLATTNFDHVLAGLMKTGLRCWPLRPNSKKPDPWPEDFDRALSASRLKAVAPHLRRLLAIRHTEELRRAKLLGSADSSIYHLHGWWRMADSVVFDCIGYDRSIKDGHVDEQLLQWLGSTKSVVLFLGMGQGANDRRFRKLWNRMKKEPAWNRAKMFWLVEKLNDVTVPELKDGQLVVKVKIPYNQQPEYLRKIVVYHSQK